MPLPLNEYFPVGLCVLLYALAEWIYSLEVPKQLSLANPEKGSDAIDDESYYSSERVPRKDKKKKELSTDSGTPSLIHRMRNSGCSFFQMLIDAFGVMCDNPLTQSPSWLATWWNEEDMEVLKVTKTKTVARFLRETRKCFYFFKRSAVLVLTSRFLALSYNARVDLHNVLSDFLHDRALWFEWYFKKLHTVYEVAFFIKSEMKDATTMLDWVTHFEKHLDDLNVDPLYIVQCVRYDLIRARLLLLWTTIIDKKKVGRRKIENLFRRIELNAEEWKDYEWVGKVLAVLQMAVDIIRHRKRFFATENPQEEVNQSTRSRKNIQKPLVFDTLEHTLEPDVDRNETRFNDDHVPVVLMGPKKTPTLDKYFGRMAENESGA